MSGLSGKMPIGNIGGGGGGTAINPFFVLWFHSLGNNGIFAGGTKYAQLNSVTADSDLVSGALVHWSGLENDVYIDLIRKIKVVELAMACDVNLGNAETSVSLRQWGTSDLVTVAAPASTTGRFFTAASVTINAGTRLLWKIVQTAGNNGKARFFVYAECEPQ